MDGDPVQLLLPWLPFKASEDPYFWPGAVAHS